MFKDIAIAGSTVHLLTLISLKVLWRNKKSNYKKNVIEWLFYSNLLLISFDIYFYLHTLLHPFSLLNQYLLYSLPFLAYCLGMIFFLYHLLFNNKTVFYSNILNNIFLIFMNAILLYLFFSSIPRAFPLFSFEVISQIIILSVTLILFDFVLLALSRANHVSIILYLSGITSIIASSFFIVYIYLSKRTDLIIYGQLLWFIGLVFIFISILTFKFYLKLSERLWFESGNPIKSRLVLSVFTISSSCFLLFFIIAYFTGMISKTLFLGAPLFFMAYSFFIITLSLYWGKSFEKPFKKLEGNIDLFVNHGCGDCLDNKFKIDEFTLIQNTIINTFSAIEQRLFLFDHLNQFAIQIAHDIRSPLAILNVCLSESIEISERERVLIEKALHDINIAFNNLLLEFRHQKNVSDIKICESL